MVAGTKEETEAARTRIKDKLSSIGLSLSEYKTQINHWSRSVRFLVYNIRGELRTRGVAIRAVLVIPQEKVQKAKEAIEKVCSFYNIPEADSLIASKSVYVPGMVQLLPICQLTSTSLWQAVEGGMVGLRTLPRPKAQSEHRRNPAARKAAKRLVAVKHNDRLKQTFEGER